MMRRVKMCLKLPLFCILFVYGCASRSIQTRVPAEISAQDSPCIEIFSKSHENKADSYRNMFHGTMNAQPVIDRFFRVSPDFKSSDGVAKFLALDVREYSVITLPEISRASLNTEIFKVREVRALQDPAQSKEELKKVQQSAELGQTRWHEM